MIMIIIIIIIEGTYYVVYAKNRNTYNLRLAQLERRFQPFVYSESIRYHYDLYHSLLSATD